MYLPPEATAAALRAIAAGLAGTTLVVNFLLPAGTLDALGHAVRDCTAAVVAAAGEPVVATYTRDEAADSTCRSPTLGAGQREGHGQAVQRTGCGPQPTG